MVRGPISVVYGSGLRVAILPAGPLGVQGVRSWSLNLTPMRFRLWEVGRRELRVGLGFRV